MLVAMTRYTARSDEASTRVVRGQRQEKIAGVKIP